MTFNEYTNSVKDKLERNGYQIYEEKPINYGLQLKTAPQNALKKNIASVNCYYSANKNKGFSLVLGIKADNPYKSDLERILNLNQGNLFQTIPLDKPLKTDQSLDEKPSPFADLSCYAGSDEAGKGDYFGPLVVCTFAAHRVQFKELILLGVKDSKLLSADEIDRIADTLVRNYKGQYRVEILNPERYNSLYSQFNNLNHLLADTHFKNIEALQKMIKPEGVIIDQFASEKSLNNVRSRYQLNNLFFMTQAESDVCVAAASIIARWFFTQYIKTMSEQYGIKFPKGAGSHVKQAVSQFRTKYGLEELAKVAKLHFKQ